jgi:acyl-CoA hydrolase
MELIDANAHGNVHGSVIMRMVDEAASIVAFKHSQNPDVVTARVETFNFLAPAYIRDVVTRARGDNISPRNALKHRGSQFLDGVRRIS